MKKTRIISLTAAALLAVAPVVASVTPVAEAAVNVDNSKPIPPTPSSATNKKLYFTFNGNIYGNGAETDLINATQFKTLGDIQKNIESNIKFFDGDTNQDVEISIQNIADQLKKQSVNVADNPTASTTVDLPNNFSIQLRALAIERNSDLTVRYFRSNSVNASAPQFRINNHTVLSTDKRVYVVGKDSNFDPTNVKPLTGSNLKFTAQQSETDNKAADISVVSNPVDTSKGNQLYTVTLIATNSAGQTTDISYQVFVLASTQQILASDAPIYSFEGGAMKSTDSSFKAGTSVYVSSYQTQSSGDDIYILASTASYAAVEGSNINTWINIKSLSGSDDYNTTGQKATVMVTSRAYDKDGKFTGRTYPAYSQISYLPEVHRINGKTYYKVSGKDEYVRVTNITGTPRLLTRNAYVYRSSYRRSAGYPKFYKNQRVITYGAAVRFKNGKSYYKISGCTATNKRYIKAVNFR